MKENKEKNTEKKIIEKQKQKQIKEIISKPKRQSFNGLSGTEWAKNSASVIDIQATSRTKDRLIHGATFPFELIDKLLIMYTKENDNVLDIFNGVGTTTTCCMRNKRNGCGIELNKQFYDFSVENIKQEEKEQEREEKEIEKEIEKEKDIIEKDTIEKDIIEKDIIEKEVIANEKNNKEITESCNGDNGLYQYFIHSDTFNNVISDNACNICSGDCGVYASGSSVDNISLYNDGNRQIDKEKEIDKEREKKKEQDKFVNNTSIYLQDVYTSKDKTINILNGDSMDIIKHLPQDYFNLVVTSPPYADLLHKVKKDRATNHKNSVFVTDNNSTAKPYSDNERDLGNYCIDDFIIKVKQIMKDLYKVMKKGAYNIWIVKDFRDCKHKIPYVDLHTKIAYAGVESGFTYHDLIILNQNLNRKLVVLGYPSVFYTNQNHSFIVVLRKV